jgi:hypoxanthine phosphoribosyltransferase
VEISQKNSPKEHCGWEEIESLTKIVSEKVRRSNKRYDAILGVTNGGIVPARLMARELNIDYIQLIPVRNKKLNKEEMPLLLQDKKYLIIDEIYDTGDTFSKVYDAVRIFDCDFAFLMSRCEHNRRGTYYVGKVLNHNKWIVFPWE